MLLKKNVKIPTAKKFKEYIHRRRNLTETKYLNCKKNNGCEMDHFVIDHIFIKRIEIEVLPFILCNFLL